MQIRGREVDFRITRLKDAAAMEKALDHMAESEKKINRKGKLTEIMSATIEMFRNFVKESTGEDVLEDCDDVEEAKNVYIEMLCEVSKQKEEALGFSMDKIK
ncbi:hypothetical protein DWZ16_04525 [Clostridium sp. AF29-8BH]|jgi:hypothetical protein|uniref:hypothetical protein n=1 Tax=Clostridium sp. AF29-8BH TaxID=2293009 RepID=UPI000E47FB53|nr:hypothetical protein DWZ16_04525 [Clostridium sp. AF29-8BH]